MAAAYTCELVHKALRAVQAGASWRLSSDVVPAAAHCSGHEHAGQRRASGRRGGGKLTKKLAGYHQFHAVSAALEETVKASHPLGDRRVGVIWHTQGAGKSLTMAFYADGALMAQVVLTRAVSFADDFADARA